MVIAGSACCESTCAASGEWVCELSGCPTHVHIHFSEKCGLLKAGHQGRCLSSKSWPLKWHSGKKVKYLISDQAF